MSAVNKLNNATSITTANEEETARIGAIVARHSKMGSCVALQGDLGAGKTVFCRGFIHEVAGKATEVTSPTFTLVQTYRALDGVPITHIDLYRIEEKEEMMETGLEEALEHGMTLIEWPDMATSYLPEECLNVRITYGRSDQERQIRFYSKQQGWDSCLKEIMAAYDHKT